MAIIPSCILDLIRQQKSDFRQVYQYTFQGKEVFEFIPQDECCDMIHPVYSKECVLLCNLNGLIGNQICKGDTFYIKATNQLLVWKK